MLCGHNSEVGRVCANSHAPTNRGADGVAEKNAEKQLSHLLLSVFLLRADLRASASRRFGGFRRIGSRLRYRRHGDAELALEDLGEDLDRFVVQMAVVGKQVVRSGHAVSGAAHVRNAAAGFLDE